MKTMAIRLMLAMGLLILPVLGMGCDNEPEGSCISTQGGSGSGDEPESYDSHQVCRAHATASSCSQAGGSFEENGSCAVFDFFQAISAN